MAPADNTKFPRYRFKNIGPIQEANLVLGDLTIIAGRNNTGKTYLVYTLYGFLQQCIAGKRKWHESGNNRIFLFRCRDWNGHQTESLVGFEKSVQSNLRLPLDL